MKKVLVGIIALFAFTMVALQSNAQTTPALKIGIFNSEEMMQNLPEYRTVDSLLQIYQRDSIGGQYEVLQSEYVRLDSTLKADTIAKRPKAIMDHNNEAKQQIASQLMNWQSISQQASQAKYVQLARPLFAKVQKSLDKVCAAQHINLVLKSDALDMGFNPVAPVVNLFLLVAKDLGLPTNETPAAGGAKK
ncbi:OmpH family outer membrane protein [Rhizosphaericola mali]|uniref:OmpH family outer membrane protein n=1 Tax=Rhizosphaericola mali TaxID=2545455 RepID=A0A5P2G4K3_9BACT|nr:OmpH family outer membrane protein [Rhizosphaericola mali]QES90756.1 OmpH family outer membrane protein [Rhizosphaericola mali]